MAIIFASIIAILAIITATMALGIAIMAHLLFPYYCNYGH